MSDIGTLNEGPLHAALKQLYSKAGDKLEVKTDRFVADIVRGNSIIEIQTGNFSAMRNKFDHLLDRHPILLVHPLAVNKWILKVDEGGETLSRRKSPKSAIPADVCEELVSFPMLISHPNFELEVILIDEEEVRAPNNSQRRRRRGGYAVKERRLLNVVDTIRIKNPQGLLQFLPEGLPINFTTKDLARCLSRSYRDARQVIYCLKTAEAIEEIGREKAGIIYRIKR